MNARERKWKLLWLHLQNYNKRGNNFYVHPTSFNTIKQSEMCINVKTQQHILWWIHRGEFALTTLSKELQSRLPNVNTRSYLRLKSLAIHKSFKTTKPNIYLLKNTIFVGDCWDGNFSCENFTSWRCRVGIFPFGDFFVWVYKCRSEILHVGRKNQLRTQRMKNCLW